MVGSQHDFRSPLEFSGCNKAWTTAPNTSHPTKREPTSCSAKRILKGSICNKSKLISSPFGQFHFHESAKKKPVIAADFFRAKAARNHNSFSSFRTCVIKEGYAAGETMVFHQFHIFFILFCQRTPQFYSMYTQGGWPIVD